MKKLIFLTTALVLCPLQHIASQQLNSELNNKIKAVEKAIEEGKKQSHDLKQQADNLKSDLSKAKYGRIIIAKTVQN